MAAQSNREVLGQFEVRKLKEGLIKGEEACIELANRNPMMPTQPTGAQASSLANVASAT